MYLQNYNKSVVFLFSYYCAQVGKLTGKKTFSSIRLANTKNATYIIEQVIPIFQSSLKRFTANATYNPNSVDSSETAEYGRPLELSVI